MEHKHWIVRIKATVITEVYTGKCSEEQAREDPWLECRCEQEIERVDWEVLDVKPNE